MLRIGIIDNHPIMRFGLGSLLKEHFNVAVDEFSTHNVLIGQLLPQKYDAVFANSDLSHEFFENLRSKLTSTKVIVVATVEVFQDAILHLSKWADGYIGKDSSSETIVKAFRMVVLEHSRFVSQTMLEKITDHALSGKTTARKEALSGREQEIAELVVEGKKTLEIASLLGLKPSTISTHKYKILQKTGSENIFQLKQRMLQRLGRYEPVSIIAKR